MIKLIKSLFFKPKVFFTSDHHHGHMKILEYCNRPYSNINDMTESLIKQWNSQVKAQDKVYFLGDFSLNKKWSAEIVPKLNGYKVLMPGNHDACFKFPPKGNTFAEIEGANRRHIRACGEYLNHGWKEIHQTLEITLKNKQRVLLSHLPYVPKENEDLDKRYIGLRPEDNGLFLLCGHLHGKFKKNNNMIDIGIDAWNLKLVSEDDIIKLIKDKRSYIPSSLTEFYKTRKEYV